MVETFIVGQTGLPVGVPNPVVNKISVAPTAALPVVASTSLPGVQTKLNPVWLRVQYNRAHQQLVMCHLSLQHLRLLIASVINPSLIFPGEGFI